MTPDELIRIESYLLDRKKPDYELSKMIMEALDLINRQQAEIERLKRSVEMWSEDAKYHFNARQPPKPKQSKSLTIS